MKTGPINGGHEKLMTVKENYTLNQLFNGGTILSISTGLK
jgi:hypothetical protein